jgi:hypothetical protein
MDNRISHSAETGRNPFPWWIYVIVSIGALLMAAGAAIGLIKPAMLVSPQDSISGAVRIYAGYMVSRNLSLAGLLLITLLKKYRTALATLMVLTAFIQLLDAILDFAEGRLPLVPGVLIFAVVFFVASAQVSGHRFWSAPAWRDRA